jgi:hypothetical protein
VVASQLTQGTQFLSQQVCCCFFNCFFLFYRLTTVTLRFFFGLKPEEPAVATVFVGNLDLENLKTITINGEQFTRQEMTKKRWWYGRHRSRRSQVPRCPTSASIRPDGYAIIRGDCLCNGKKQEVLKIGEIARISAEMKEFIKTKYPEFGRLSAKDAANKIHGLFTDQYAGRAFVGLSVDQVYNLVRNLRNQDAGGERKFWEWPLVNCSPADERPFLQFIKRTNVVCDTSGRRKSEHTHMMGWAHPGGCASNL